MRTCGSEGGASDSDGSGDAASDSEGDDSGDSGSAGSEPDDFPFSDDDDEDDAAPPRQEKKAAAAPPQQQEKKKRKGASPFADADAYFSAHPEQLDEDGDVEAPVPGELPTKKKKRRGAAGEISTEALVAELARAAGG